MDTREKNRLRQAKYRAQHREEQAAYQREVRRRRKAEGGCISCGQVPLVTQTLCQACSDKMQYNYNSKKRQVYEHYGKTCACCGEAEDSFLSIDHINNDGASHRKTLTGNGTGIALYTWLIQHGFPPEFQVLCWNCQWGKKKNNGVCPHQDPASPSYLGNSATI